MLLIVKCFSSDHLHIDLHSFMRQIFSFERLYRIFSVCFTIRMRRNTSFSRCTTWSLTHFSPKKLVSWSICLQVPMIRMSSSNCYKYFIASVNIESPLLCDSNLVVDSSEIELHLNSAKRIEDCTLLSTLWRWERWRNCAWSSSMTPSIRC